jgi:hypothetical protein
MIYHLIPGLSLHGVQVEERIALAAGQGQRFLGWPSFSAKSLKNLPMAGAA